MKISYADPNSRVQWRRLRGKTVCESLQHYIFCKFEAKPRLIHNHLK